MSSERGQGRAELALTIGVVSVAALIALGFLSGKIYGLYSKTGDSPDAATAGVGRGGTPPPNGTVVTIAGRAYRFYNPGPSHAGDDLSDCGGDDLSCGGHAGFYTDSATRPNAFRSDTGSWSGDYAPNPPWSFTCMWHSSGWWDPDGPAWQFGCW